MTKTLTLTLTLAVAACTAFTLAPASAGVIVNETFGGDNSDLNTTTAETFDAGITTAGGSGTWVAATDIFESDGDVVEASEESAYLNMGSYINDSKGTASGKFTLSATLSTFTGSWGGFGFFESNTPNVAEAFVNSAALGMGIFIYRNTGDLDGFAGPGSSNNVNGPNVSGTQLLTIVLDLTPAGGYDGTTNFGTITFIDGDADTGSPLGSYMYTADESFGSIGLTASGGPVPGNSGSYSSFQLEQVVIPEPASLALLTLGGLMIVTRRRG